MTEDDHAYREGHDAALRTVVDRLDYVIDGRIGLKEFKQLVLSWCFDKDPAPKLPNPIAFISKDTKDLEITLRDMAQAINQLVHYLREKEKRSNG